MSIQLAQSYEEITACYPVMAQLRPHLSEADFVEQVLRQQHGGYTLAFLLAEAHIVAVAGFKVNESLSLGKYLYIDDFVTDTTVRSAGHGRSLLDWLIAYGVEQGCSELRLDSSVLRQRAHRFYFANKMHIHGYHFALSLRAPND